jgi:hypothetical protein
MRGLRRTIRNDAAEGLTIAGSRISLAGRICRRKESLMFVTLVAVLCHVLPGGPRDCVEEIVSDSSQSNITFQSCMIQGQIGITKWMSEHPVYRTNWTLDRYKCAPGHYQLHVKA